MVEKDPTTWSVATWALGIGMAVAGGFVNFMVKVKKGHARLFNFVELFGEIFISGFVGLGSYMLILSMDQSVGLAAVAAGIGGHMGTKLLFLVEQYFMEKYTPQPRRRKND